MAQMPEYRKRSFKEVFVGANDQGMLKQSFHLVVHLSEQSMLQRMILCTHTASFVSPFHFEIFRKALDFLTVFNPNYSINLGRLFKTLN